MPKAAPKSVAREIERAEGQFEALVKKLAKLRKKLPPKPVGEYAFQGHDGKPLRLSDAFGKHGDLIVVHNMGSG